MLLLQDCPLTNDKAVHDTSELCGLLGYGLHVGVGGCKSPCDGCCMVPVGEDLTVPHTPQQTIYVGGLKLLQLH